MRLWMIAILLAACDAQPTVTAEPSAAPTPDSRLEGTFVGWDAVDDERGFAIITLRNDSLEEVSAECEVTVTNDFRRHRQRDDGTGDPATK